MFFLYQKNEPESLGVNAIQNKQVLKSEMPEVNLKSDIPKQDKRKQVYRELASSSSVKPSSVVQERSVSSRFPSDVSTFKKQLGKKISSEKIKKYLYKGKTHKVGKVSFSKNIRAEVSNEMRADAMGTFGEFLIFNEQSSSGLQNGQYYVAYDNEKKTIAFATGRLVVEITDDFVESSIKDLNLEITEKPSEDLKLIFLSPIQGSLNYDKATLGLSKLPGVRSIRAELIYNRAKQQ